MSVSAPDFAILQHESPQREVLAWLDTLTDTWRRIKSQRTSAEDMALGVLFHAKGIEVRGTDEARLSVNGERWQKFLQTADQNNLTTVRGLVLRFVWDCYCKNVPDTQSSPLSPTPLLETPAPTPTVANEGGAPPTAPPAAEQGEGGKPPAGRSKGIPRAEAEILVREWLAANAKGNPAAVTRDAVAAGTGVSGASVSRTAAWKAFRDRRDAEAKPGQGKYL